MMLKFLNRKTLFRIYIFFALIFLVYSILYNFLNTQENYLDNYLINRGKLIFFLKIVIKNF